MFAAATKRKGKKPYLLKARFLLDCQPKAHDTSAMNPRNCLAGIIWLFAGLALNFSDLFAQEQPTPIRLQPGPHLFLDDFLIQQSSNVVRRIDSPRRDLTQPVVTGKEDGNFQPYVTVLREPQTQRFRMWYNVPVNGGQSHLACIDSDDGIHWIRPRRVLQIPARIAFGASVLDEGPAFIDPARRFKFAWYNGGMMMARSADGLNWTADPPHPVITGINDILHLAHDSPRKRYIAVFGFPSRPEDGYKGKTQNAPAGYRRCVGQSTSTDGLQWTSPQRIFAPDSEDEGITEFYSAGGVICRGEMLIGLLKVLRDDLPCDQGGKVDGIGYTVLAWTHDGEHWQRDRQPFFDRNHEKGTWDRAMAWMDYQLPIGDEIFLYYGGYARGHKVERFTERQIGLVRIKRDRYVAHQAQGTGILLSRLVTIEGQSLALNVDASRGAARVQILDLKNRPVSGFRFADCASVTADALEASLNWKRPLKDLQGKPVRLEIELRNADLFAMEVKSNP